MCRKLILIVVAVLMLGTFGCQMEDAQTIKEFSGNVQILSARVDDYQKEVSEMATLLEEDNIIDSKVVARLDKINEEIDRVQPQIDEMAEAGKEFGEGGGWDAVKAINQASAPWNPYAAIIAGVLAIIETITILLLKKKSDESNANRALYADEAIKRKAGEVGQQKAMLELAAMEDKDVTAPLVNKLIYENVGVERRANGV